MEKKTKTIEPYDVRMARVARQEREWHEKRVQQIFEERMIKRLKR